MRSRKRLLTAGAFTALLVGGGLAGPASAGAAEAGGAQRGGGEAGTMDTAVTVYFDELSVRDEPELAGTLDYTAHDGDVLNGECWVYGEEVTAGGVTNDVWIQTGDPPFDDEYVWAGGLEGDKYANVPNQC